MKLFAITAIAAPAVIGLGLIHHGHTQSVEGPLWLGVLLLAGALWALLYTIADRKLIQPLLQQQRDAELRRNHLNQREEDHESEEDLMKILRSLPYQ